MNSKLKVVIVGGGFAGLNAAKNLGKFRELNITLIDQKNHHLFQPLLYQVATAGLSPADIATPIRSVLAKYPNLNTRLEKVVNILPSEKKVIFKESEMTYDYLILACGATHSYFGKNHWEGSAPGLKTLEEATEIRRRILLCFEEAEKATSHDEKKIWQTFVIVGGGPTGVELAGALAEMSRFTLEKDFRHINPAETTIILVEAGPRILSTFSEDLASKAHQTLEKMGVSVRVNCKVSNINSQGVEMAGDFVATRCALWAAGVKPNVLNQCLNTELDPQGRVFVENDFSLKKYPEVFVLGDQAHFSGSAGTALPAVASVALQQGQHMKKIFAAIIKGKPRPGFKYVDKGQMATIGRGQAIVQSSQFSIKGFTAWLMWLFVHIYYLIGFKNRLLVFIQWSWNYFTYARGARLIVSKEWRSFPESKG